MLLQSAEIASPEEEKPSDSSLTMSVLFAAVLAVGLFIVLPSFATEWIMRTVSLSGGTWVSFIAVSYTHLAYALCFISKIIRVHSNAMTTD